MIQKGFYYTLIAIVTVGAIVSCKPKTEHTEVKAIAVKTQRILADKHVVQQEYVGTVESDNALEISFLLLGTIEKMYANEGQSVFKGQVLASLNKSTLQSAYNLTSATLKQAEDAHKRMSVMYELSLIHI